MSVSKPSSIRLALRELRRHLSTPMGVATMVALTLVPSIYAGLYLYANHDPYAALNRVPAALVVQDTGATTQQGRQLEAGDQIADQLMEQRDFDWHLVSAPEARAGVAEGTYDFALVIPKDFSSSLTSSAGKDPHQAQLRMVTNDANSYLSTTIANTVTSKVRTAIGERVSEEATTTFLIGIADVRKGLVDGADGAETLHDGLVSARDGASHLRDGTGQLHEGASELTEGAQRLEAGLGTMQERVAPLPRQARALATGADKVADGNAEVAATGDKVASAVHTARAAYRANRSLLVQRLKEAGLDADQRKEVLDVYDGLGEPVRAADAKAARTSRQLDRLARGARQVADGNRRIADGLPGLVIGIDQAHGGARQLSEGTTQLEVGADELHTGARELTSGVAELGRGSARLERGLRHGASQVPATDKKTRQRIADTIADPVVVDSTSQAQARTYGDGLAPFFLALATWIGAYVLFIVLHPFISGREREHVYGWRAALAGWLPSAVVASVQATIMVLVAAYAIGIAPVDLPATWAFLVLSAVVFTAIVHAFTAALGQAGQFLALILMVLQLVTAGGTFPWQTIPVSLHWLHHVLPMSYAVDGLRQIMYGAPSPRLAADVAVLVTWGLVAVSISILVGARRGGHAPTADLPSAQPVRA